MTNINTTTLTDSDLDLAVGGLVCISTETKVDMPKGILIIGSVTCEGSGVPPIPYVIFEPRGK